MPPKFVRPVLQIGCVPVGSSQIMLRKLAMGFLLVLCSMCSLTLFQQACGQSQGVKPSDVKLVPQTNKSICWLKLADYVALGSQIPVECLKADADLQMAWDAVAAFKANAKKEMGHGHVEAVRKDGPRVFVGVLTGPAEVKRRQSWRIDWECGHQLDAAGIPYKFIVGWPIDPKRSLKVHEHGLKAFDSEALMATQLRNESAEHRDLAFFDFPDTWIGLQTKTFALLQYGYSLGASYVVKLDDDACVNASQLLLGIEEHEARVKKGGPSALYAGAVVKQGTEYHGMKGKDNSTHPYYTGLCYILSQDLIQPIIEDDKMNTVLWAPYGSFDEDAQTGRWVAFAQAHHNISVDWQLLDDLMSNSTHKLPNSTDKPGSSRVKKC